MTKTYEVIKIDNELAVVVDKRYGEIVPPVPNAWHVCLDEIRSNALPENKNCQVNVLVFHREEVGHCGGCRQILATIGTKHLEGVPVIGLPEYKINSTEVNIAWEIVKKQLQGIGKPIILKEYKDFFILGYETAQGQYTEEDMKFILDSFELNFSGAKTKEDYKKRVEKFSKWFTNGFINKSLQIKQFPISVELEQTYEPTSSLSSRGCVLSDEECSCDASESSWCKHRFAVKYNEKLKITNPSTNTIIPIKVNYQ